MKLIRSIKTSLNQNYSNVLLLAISGFIFYYSFMFAASLFYPGGYNIFTDYFSDLGRTITPEGKDNLISFVLFIIGTSLVGLFFIPFWMRYYLTFKPKSVSRKIALVGSVFGVSVIFGLIGIALVPINIWLDLHATFSFIYYLSISLSLLCYSLAIRLDTNYPNISSYLGILIVTFEILFMIGIFSNIEPLIQKLTSLCFFCWFILQYSILHRGFNSSDIVITS